MDKRHVYITSESGTVVSLLNDTDTHQDINYACVTAPAMTLIKVWMLEEGEDPSDGNLFDAVWVGPGSSHSWWTQAGGKLLDHNGLDPASRLLVTSSDSGVALRVDWF